jgi:hypothetical protein
MRPPAVEIVAVMIPVIAIVMGIGIGMLALTLNYRRKREIFQLYHAQRMAAIEKGVDLPPLPPELFDGFQRASGPPQYVHLRRGFMLVFLGAVLFVALYASAGPENAWWGLIPAAVGLADLLFYFLAGRKLAARDTMPGTPPGSQAEETLYPGSKR